jgi:hypothetical protein
VQGAAETIEPGGACIGLHNLHIPDGKRLPRERMDTGAAPLAVAARKRDGIEFRERRAPRGDRFDIHRPRGGEQPAPREGELDVSPQGLHALTE